VSARPRRDAREQRPMSIQLTYLRISAAWRRGSSLGPPALRPRGKRRR
jgi:hypothetical protein